jgi:hypothetical protein
LICIVEITQISEVSFLLTIVLESEDTLMLKLEFDRNVIQNSSVGGFRKGKAPLRVIINKYGRDKYYKDLREYIALKAFEEATKNGNRINPIVKPTFEFADWEEGGKFVFTATVINHPEDPSDKFISPDFDVPSHSNRIRVSEEIPGIPGQMPMIDGKLPPHLSVKDPSPKIPNIMESNLPGAEGIEKGDPSEPIHQKLKPPHEQLQTPAQNKSSRKKPSGSSDGD